MANLAVAAATAYLTDNTLTGSALPASETNSLSTYTGFTFPNVPEGLVVVRITVGSSGAGNATVTVTNGGSNVVKALSNSTIYILGPFDPAVYSNSSGLVTVAMSVVTGNAVGVYIVPGSVALAGYRALHNPFEMTAGAQDR